MTQITKYNTYEVTVLHLNIHMYFIPFPLNILGLCWLHRSQGRTEVTPVYKKSFWKEVKANAVEIMWSGKEGDTVLVEILQDGL